MSLGLAIKAARMAVEIRTALKERYVPRAGIGSRFLIFTVIPRIPLPRAGGIADARFVITLDANSSARGVPNFVPTRKPDELTSVAMERRASIQRIATYRNLSVDRRKSRKCFVFGV